MALTKCRECGSQISSSAAACPQCGAKPRRPGGCAIVVLLFLAVLIVVAMFSAVRESGERADRQRAQAEATTKAQQEKAAQEAVFAKHREQVLLVAKDALDRDDLAAAEEAIKPLAKVNDGDLQKLRDELKSKKAAAAAVVELAQLKEEARTLKKGDVSNGYRIYSRLSDLEPENKSYQAKLSQFGEAKLAQELAARKQAALDARRLLARTTEENFLKNGQSVTIKAKGKDETDLHIEYVMVSKAFAYQVQHQEEFMTACRLAGFKRIILHDGFRETWTITL